MSQNEFYEYNLSTEDKKQSLKLSLLEDKISMVLENQTNQNEKENPYQINRCRKST